MSTRTEDDLRAERAVLIEEHQDLLNAILDEAPGSWDDDAGADAITIEYVQTMVERLKDRGGCLHKCCRWEDHEPCDHGYLPEPITESEPF